MSEYRGFDILDYILVILKWKKFLIVLGVTTLVLSYISIYFLIPEQFDSEALIISSDSEDLGGLSSLLSSFSDLPIGIPGLGGGGNTDRFSTIIYSRSNLDKIIKEFDLFEEYGLDNMNKTREALADNIEADDTKEGAYKIKVRASSPQKTADMTNFIVENLNKTLIELNTAKSKDNREFLGTRYNEIKTQLKIAEDSLVTYQQTSGILLAEEQAVSSFEAYAKLEAELATKQIEATVIEKLYGKDSPLVLNSKIAADEFKNKLDRIKSGKDNTGVILSMNKLPQRTMGYLRFFRDVEIYNKMLAFIIPLYEQSKFEEQKNIPLLQIIDEAVPPEKKSYPSRTLFAIFLMLIVLMFASAVLIMREAIINSDNPKVKIAMQNLFRKKSS